MSYGRSEAGELILKACSELAKHKLIIRTWGNISARLSSDLMLITPSGMDYETMTVDDLVAVNITDGRAEPDKTPSSEAGVHMVCYRARPDVNFVIHTHQPYASALSVLGSNIKLGDRVSDETKHLVGPGLICAQYGPNGSKKISKAVAECLEDHPQTGHVLLKNHGAVCLGTDFDNAFNIAYTLEGLSEKVYEYYCNDVIPLTEQIRRFMKDHSDAAPSDEPVPDPITVVQSVPDGLDPDTESVGQWILHVRTPYICEISSRDTTLRAYLDDQAQIAGASIRCVSAGADRKTVMKAMGSCNAVLSEGNGAYCTGQTYDEALCVAEVLEKGCMAAYLGLIRDVDPIGTLDAAMDRYKYVKHYSALRRSKS